VADGGISVVVFDFDGTLVDSNALKREAYYEIFPAGERYRGIIGKVLETCFEESRFVIIREILAAAGVPEGEDVEASSRALADRYGERVTLAAKFCPARRGAGEILRRLSQSHHLYLSSTTPEASLKEIVAHRGWTRFFKGISGYPKRKEDFLREVLQAEGVAPRNVLVVGDGQSDRVSAEKTGAHFLALGPGVELAAVIDLVQAAP
jgi:phosphoglycolate phosphatase-like HAD superfamily hydrolase